MKIVLFVEGYTERELPPFLKRWLDPLLAQPVGMLPVRFDGNMAYLREAGRKARLYLDQPDTLAVFGLLDLYGLKLDYPRLADRDERLRFARQNVLERIDPAYREGFRQHFAVHELEAWLLSDERLFPSITLPPNAARPEDINFDTRYGWPMNPVTMSRCGRACNLSSKKTGCPTGGASPIEVSVVVEAKRWRKLQ